MAKMEQFEQSYEKLRAFEKWWKEIGQYSFSTYLTKEQSKVIWKAALEFAINEENYCTSLRCCVREKIDEELGNE